MGVVNARGSSGVGVPRAEGRVPDRRADDGMAWRARNEPPGQEGCDSGTSSLNMRRFGRGGIRGPTRRISLLMVSPPRSGGG